MADYLLSNNQLSVEGQQEIFSIRCQINPLPCNLGEVRLCETGCGNTLTNSHILECLVLNEGKIYYYDKLENGTLEEMKEMLIIWNRNIVKRENIISTQDSM